MSNTTTKLRRRKSEHNHIGEGNALIIMCASCSEGSWRYTQPWPEVDGAYTAVIHAHHLKRGVMAPGIQDGDHDATLGDMPARICCHLAHDDKIMQQLGWPGALEA